ncbi:hypothetical protein [Microbacterium sp. NIBRBAC000506063]|uniref:hypothetical protein n=1 Tax=Microbacterium sp. NIBRBAC000506063 TaxID=2734618 RepID=UPI0039800205
MSASRRPWEISGWYGVYAVYQEGSPGHCAGSPRGDRAVVAEAEHRRVHPVARGEQAQLRQRLRLGCRGGMLEADEGAVKIEPGTAWRMSASTGRSAVEVSMPSASSI